MSCGKKRRVRCSVEPTVCLLSVSVVEEVLSREEWSSIVRRPPHPKGVQRSWFPKAQQVCSYPVRLPWFFFSCATNVSSICVVTESRECRSFAVGRRLRCWLVDDALCVFSSRMSTYVYCVMKSLFLMTFTVRVRLFDEDKSIATG